MLLAATLMPPPPFRFSASLRCRFALFFVLAFRFADA